MRLTENITTEELRCPCGCGFGDKPDDYAPELLDMLQEIRDRRGRALFFSSGARCVEYNNSPKLKQSGSAEWSAHLPDPRKEHRHFKKCRGVDCVMTGGPDRIEFIEMAYAVGFRRIGVAKSFTHLDVAYGGPYVESMWVY